MSVNDFITEQEYFNHKRNLINRLILGTGIACGLKTEKDMKEASMLNVSAGAAIDSWGREIIVPDRQRLSVLSIIPLQKGAIYESGRMYPFYLKLDYVEYGEELAFSLAKADSQCEMAAEHNHIHEGYKLSLVPENLVKAESVYPVWYKSQIIYKDDGIQIERSVPEYISAGDVFKIYMKLTLLDGKMDLPNKWTIIQSLSGCSLYGQGGRVLITRFSSVYGANTDRFEVVHELRADDEACPGKIHTEKIEIDGIGSRSPAGDADSEFRVVESSMVSETANFLIMEKSLEWDRDRSKCESIYLSKVILKCTDGGEPSFTVEQIEDVPSSLKSSVYNNEMIFNLVCQLEEREKEQRNDLKSEILDIKENNEFKISTGIVEFNDLEIGKDYYSEEIDPGFGRVPFIVDLGIEMPDSGEGFFGDAEFFTGSEEYKEKYPNVVMGAVVNPEKGSFMIGIRQKTEEPVWEKIVIRWRAQRLDGEM